MVIVTTWLLVRARVLWFTSAVLTAAALVLTYKRTYWAAYATGGAFATLLALTGAWPRPRRAVAGAVATAAAIALGIGIAVLAGLDTENAVRRGEGLARPTEVPTVVTRADELVEVIAHVSTAPFGYGLGAAPKIPFGDPDGTPTHYTHTIYLQWCLQAGIPTALAGVLLIGVLVLRLVRRRADPAAMALAAALSALAVAGLALQSLNSPVSALVVGLAACLASSAPGARTSPAPLRRPLPRPGGPPGERAP
jgi:O-antigen ligase